MKKILVVDDTKNIRMLLKKCLELEGYEVEAAGDGRQALELFEKNRYDLAFLDIKLPEVRGTEVLKRIRDMGITTPVIIITAYATVKNAVDCTKMGAIAYLQKPFTGDKILSVLNELKFNEENCLEGKSSTDKPVHEAKSFLEKGDFSSALNAAKKALSEELNDAEVYLIISEAYKGLGNKNEADRFYSFFKSFSKEIQ